MSHNLNNLKVIPLKYPGLYKNIYLMHIADQIGMKKVNSFLQSIFIMGKKTPLGIPSVKFYLLFINLYNTLRLRLKSYEKCSKSLFFYINSMQKTLNNDSNTINCLIIK